MRIKESGEWLLLTHEFLAAVATRLTVLERMVKAYQQENPGCSHIEATDTIYRLFASVLGRTWMAAPRPPAQQLIQQAPSLFQIIQLVHSSVVDPELLEDVLVPDLEFGKLILGLHHVNSGGADLAGFAVIGSFTAAQSVRKTFKVTDIVSGDPG